MNSLSRLDSELDDIRRSGLYRSMRKVQGAQSSRVTVDGRGCLLLCSNNYLGLADHPALKAASVEAIMRYGTSSGASRLVSGSMEPHDLLEKQVAQFKGTEAALVFNSGHAANTGIIPVLAGRGDVILCDRLNHASIIDGALLSGARLVRYPHNDHEALASLMEKQTGVRRMLIVTDGVFSMDGDIAPLREIVALKNRFGALLMVDDAHGSGVLGDKGRGTAELLGVPDGIDIQMGTFGKALGSFGAYAATSSVIRDLLVNRARSFIFSTSLPPAVVAASSAALTIVMSSEGALLRERLRENTRLFRHRLHSDGFSTGEGLTQIIPLITGSPDVTMRFSNVLFEKGIFAQGIRPPTVPAGSCRLRFTIMATHTTEELEWAALMIAETGRDLGVI